MLEGIYSIYFSGVTGEGFGLLNINGGKITGADAAGALYDGEYFVTDEGIKGEIILSAHQGVRLVTGATAGESGAEWKFPIFLPKNFSDGQVFPITTPTGNVNVIFRKIRDA
ncbi:MAG TPA: hypothetical protein PLO23_08995 [Alphaproteobacteria bacterium]|nr:hypothetical protein [Alphaproteobacteria bacterium]